MRNTIKLDLERRGGIAFGQRRRLGVAMIFLALGALFFQPSMPTAPAADDAGTRSAAVSSARDLWEGRFSQCSFNAVGSVLRFCYGANPSIGDVEKFERAVFREPLDSTGYGAYFGWGPWTSYMVESGRMVWNGQPVTGLRTEHFSLRPVAQPEVKGRLILVHYVAGEREALRAKLANALMRGPVVMWSPYAAMQDGQFFQPWHHVSRIDDRTDAVPFGPFTHSVTLFLRPRASDAPGGADDLAGGQVIVTDCSVPNGLFVTDLDTLVSTSAAMTSFVRRSLNGEKSILERGLRGVKNDEYNVVFLRQ